MGPGADPAILIKIWQEAFPDSGGGDIFAAMLSMVAVGVVVLVIVAIRLRKKH